MNTQYRFLKYGVLATCFALAACGDGSSGTIPAATNTVNGSMARIDGRIDGVSLD